MNTSPLTNTSPSRLKIYFLESYFEFLKSLRMPAFAIPSLVFPWMFYIFFGLIFNQGGSQAPAYLMATYGTFGVIGPAMFSFGVGTAIEKDQGWLALKQASPMPISAYFLAKIINALIFGLIICLGLFALGGFAGGVTLTRTQWLMTLVTLLVGSLPFSAIGLWLGLALKSQAAPAVVNLIYLPMAFLSGLWIPIHLFPDWLQTIAWFLPAFHLSQLALSIQDKGLDFPTLYHLGAMLITSLIFITLAVFAFKKQSK